MQFVDYAKITWLFTDNDKRAWEVSNWSVYKCMRSCAHKVPTVWRQMPKEKKTRVNPQGEPRWKKKKKKKKKKKYRNTVPLIFHVDAIYKISGS